MLLASANALAQKVVQLLYTLHTLTLNSSSIILRFSGYFGGHVCCQGINQFFVLRSYKYIDSTMLQMLLARRSRPPTRSQNKGRSSDLGTSKVPM